MGVVWASQNIDPKCFTLSRYGRESGKWEMEKAPIYHIID
jgi:hypothetical protein